MSESRPFISSSAQAKAHWVNRDTIAWPGADPGGSYRLYYSLLGGIRVDTQSGVQGGAFVPLTVIPSGVPPSVLERSPHLKGAAAWAPTAQSVRLLTYDDPESTIPVIRDDRKRARSLGGLRR
jgi:hypothetical protein